MQNVYSNKRMFGISQLFNISYFAFLRKYAAVKKEFQLINYGITKFEIRNIPLGSDRYYVCYPEHCIAHGFDAVRNEAGEIVEIINRQEAKFQEEVDSFISVQTDPEDGCYTLDSTYPIADPHYDGIYVFEDERLSFEESNSYHRKKANCEKAIKALENDLNDIFLNPKEIQQWLKKHHTFYWSLQLDWNYKAFSRFQSLYFNLRYGADYLVQAATAKEAVEEYIPFDDDWLYKYDRFYYCKFSGFGSSYKVWSEDPFILEQTYQSIYLVGEEFKYLYQFSVMFEREIKIFREGDDF